MTEIGGAALVFATDRFAFALVEIFVFKFVSLTVERWQAPRVINKVEITTAKTKPRGCTSAVFITVISPKIYFLQKDSNYKGGELGKVLRIADCWPVCQWSVVRSLWLLGIDFAPVHQLTIDYRNEQRTTDNHLPTN